MAVCQKGTVSINAGDQRTKIQDYECKKDLPNLASRLLHIPYICQHNTCSQVKFQVTFKYILGL